MAVEPSFPQHTLDQKDLLRPFRARRHVGMFLGLKPQAESYHPFGIKSDNPLQGRKFLGTCPQNRLHITPRIEDEGECERAIANR